MAEVTSSLSTDTFSKVSNTTAPVVAPPKFVFGSGMSERVKKSVDDESDTSEKEEEPSESGIEFLHNASAALKRSADSDDDGGNLEGCLDFHYIPKKMMKKGSPEPKGTNVLRPSALSAIANKLTNTIQQDDGEKDENVDPKDDKCAAKVTASRYRNAFARLPQTHGESSNSSNSSDSLTSVSRPHLIDTPAPLNTGVESENYFQQFLQGKSAASSSSESKGSFVFGQNIRERVEVEPSSKDAEDVLSKVPEEADSPQSLADLADKGSKSPVETESPQNSIAAAAQKYESEHSPPKQNLAEVHVMTGEEDERNVLQHKLYQAPHMELFTSFEARAVLKSCKAGKISMLNTVNRKRRIEAFSSVNCRLFIYCTGTHSWLGRGRVLLKLNDHCQLNSEGTFHSRLVARTQGNLRLVLNTKLWPEMVLEKASEKAIRVSAMEDGKIQLYLIMAATRDVLQLYTAIDRRIETLKRDQFPNQKHSEDTEELTETTEKNSEGKEGDYDDDNEKKGENENISNDDTQASSK